MVVDRRHDHGFRIPRPDLTLRLGVPNACNDCHVERSARWAAEALDRWRGPRWRERAHFAEPLHSGRTGRADAEKALARLAEDVEQAPLVRATALSLLPAYLSASSLPVVERSLRDADPLVRLASLELAEALSPELRAKLLAPLLVDPTRVVRAEAAAALAGPPERLLGVQARVHFARALAEYRAAQDANLDRPESHLNLSLLHLRREELPQAERACAEALRVAPWFIPARVNLAEIQRLRGRETEAEASLRKALEIDPENAEVRYALGLSLVRQRRPAEALEELERATRSRPGNARFGHAHALALQSVGRDDEALEVLRRTHERVPASREVLLALIESHRRRGELETARGYAERLYEILPEEPGARDLLEALGQSP
jgi:Flp pilus assembly protein TadD